MIDINGNEYTPELPTEPIPSPPPVPTYRHPQFPRAGTLKPDNAEHAALLEARGWVALPEPPPAEPEPIREVATWALREALIKAGTKATVDSAIRDLTGKDKEVAENRWLAKPTMRRNEPLMLAVIQRLNWTPAQADALFAAAHTIQTS